ncbi:hypothetical protein CDV31_009790 [Fusarium ambrosium]|uniref:Uncharacterized protein n=1 Tax=Fusarium ambrosium TaxID=131363 RepID=A0A428TSV8_9HYPO|nr:hypothetical protein CDV31_009790 [Fusarium ambrosium]
MANAPEPTSASSALGQWVEDLFNRIWFQPDDSISAGSYDESVAPDFIARVNHDRFSRDQFFALIRQARLQSIINMQRTSPATVISSTVQITVGGINRSNGMSVPDIMLSNLAAGTLTAAGSQQVAEMVTDLKIGFFLGTPPRLQWYAQILGCLPAIFLSPGLFILVSKAYECVLDPSQAATCPFTAPAVSLWTVLATAVVEPKLPIPQSSWIFSIGISVFSIAVHLLRNWARENNYRKIYNFTPNMVMVALGLIVPAIQYSIALVIGGIIALVWLRKWPASHALYLFPVAAGMIAGESIGGIFNAILTLAKVSGPTYYGTTIGCPAE